MCVQQTKVQVANEYMRRFNVHRLPRGAPLVARGGTRMNGSKGQVGASQPQRRDEAGNATRLVLVVSSVAAPRCACAGGSLESRKRRAESELQSPLSKQAHQEPSVDASESEQKVRPAHLPAHLPACITCCSA